MLKFMFGQNMIMWVGILWKGAIKAKKKTKAGLNCIKIGSNSICSFIECESMLNSKAMMTIEWSDLDWISYKGSKDYVSFWFRVISVN